MAQHGPPPKPTSHSSLSAPLRLRLRLRSCSAAVSLLALFAAALCALPSAAHAAALDTAKLADDKITPTPASGAASSHAADRFHMFSITPARAVAGQPVSVTWRTAAGDAAARSHEWIGAFPAAKRCEDNRCFAAYSHYLPVGASAGATSLAISKAGRYVLRMCEGFSALTGYSCRDGASAPFIVSACADSETIWVDLDAILDVGDPADDRRRRTSSSSSSSSSSSASSAALLHARPPTATVDPFCSVSFALTGRAVLRRSVVTSYIEATFAHGRAHGKLTPLLSVFTDDTVGTASSADPPQSSGVGSIIHGFSANNNNNNNNNNNLGGARAYDVLATSVPSLTSPDIVVTVVSEESKPVHAVLRVARLLGCASPTCGRGYCDARLGRCVCDPGYFGSGCAQGHTEWMRTHRPIRPLLLVPGLAGSQLVARNRVSGAEKKCWVELPSSLEGIIMRTVHLEADRNVRRFLVGRFDPSTGAVLPLATAAAEDWTVVAPREGYGLEAVSDLVRGSGTVARAIRAIHRSAYLAPLIRRLENAGYTRGEDLFAFPYDWRESTRSVKLVDELRDTIRDIHASTGRRVELVTHSMGGLLVRSYLALYGEEAGAMVSMWVAVACPFNGASGLAMEAFLQGHRFGNPFLRRETARAMAVGMPSAYELLPAAGVDWITPRLSCRSPRSPTRSQVRAASCALRTRRGSCSPARCGASRCARAGTSTRARFSARPRTGPTARAICGALPPRARRDRSGSSTSMA
jgi:pimeloyl-ACP methyl ester carboxylesterase